MSGVQQLNYCKQLYQATLNCKDQCEKLVPEAFNAALLDALQHLMLLAVQLQQKEQLQDVRSCLKAALQLLSRVSSLGPVEAFFVADELLTHYQWRLDSTHSLLCRLGEKQPCCSKSSQSAEAAAGAVTDPAHEPVPGGCSKRQLKLPEHQQQVVQQFRCQAAKLCPMLVQSSPASELQRLCDTVKQGLVLVNGHSFLIGQEWQAEAAAMLARAEQLKVILAHRQAHHLSLLAAVLQHLHQQEVQQYDMPHSRSISASKWPHIPAVSLVQIEAGQVLTGPEQVHQQQEVVVGGLAAAVSQQLQQYEAPLVSAQAALHTEFHSVCWDEALLDLEEDEFFLPVAPLGASAAGSPDGRASIHTATGPPTLPYHMAPAAQNSGEAVSVGDSLARTPSSGCNSLLDYVQHSMSPAKQAVQDTTGQGPNSAGGSPRGASTQQSLHSIEQQLMSISGSAEVAAVMASALGYEQLPCSRTSSYCRGVSSAGGASVISMPGTSGAGAGSLTFLAGSTQSSPGHSSPASVLGRLSSSAAKALEGLAADRSSIAGLVPQQQQQQQRRRWQRPQKASSTFCLQHVQLPPGCCKSIGAACYLCPHLKRIVLIDVGLTDKDVGDLVDALKVNSSIQHLDLSHNSLEDIGARLLALLLKPSVGSSSRLHSLCLQHNQIGDDGAAALASGLAHSTQLQRLWLQDNAIGQAGAKALCKAMQHNTACIDLKLQEGNEGVPAQLAQMVQQLARQNRGARDHIMGLLKLVHWSPS